MSSEYYLRLVNKVNLLQTLSLPIMLATVMWSLRMIYLEENQRNEFKKYFKIHPPSNTRIRIDILQDSNKLQTMMKNQKIDLRRIFNCEHYNDSRINRKAKSRDKTHQQTKESKTLTVTMSRLKYIHECFSRYGTAPQLQLGEER